MNILSLRDRLVSIFYRAATSSSRVRTLLTPGGLAFFLTLVALFVIGSLWMDRSLGFPELLPISWAIAVSVPILTIGLFLILWSIVHFAKARGTPVPFNPPPRLVTTGPYAYVRNPMLSGVFILFFGLGILFNSLSLIFIFTPIFIVLNLLELRAVEEQELGKRFGREYTEYKKRVPMFIPWLKVKNKK